MFKNIKSKTLIILIAFLIYCFGYISGKQRIVGHLKNFFGYHYDSKGCAKGFYINNICTSSSFSPNENQEIIILKNLSKYKISKNYPKKEFKNYLKRSVGWNNIPTSKIHCTDQNISECFVKYETMFKLRYLFTKGEENLPLVIILHGHQSSANKVLGNENEDYMRKIGVQLMKANYSVVAPDLTSDAYLSSELNSQLNLYGIQLFGLWSRFICDISQHYSEKEIIIYGLSNGGIIADHVSILCDSNNIKHIFVDDIMTDTYDQFKNHKSIYKKQNYWLFYFSAFHFESNYLDFILSSSYNKTYIQTNLPQSFPEKCLTINENKVSRIKQIIPFHVVQSEILTSFLENGYNENYIFFDKNCIENNALNLDKK